MPRGIGSEVIVRQGVVRDMTRSGGRRLDELTPQEVQEEVEKMRVEGTDVMLGSQTQPIAYDGSFEVAKSAARDALSGKY